MTAENVYQENMQVWEQICSCVYVCQKYSRPAQHIQHFSFNKKKTTNWRPFKIKLILILRDAKLVKQSVLSMSETIYDFYSNTHYNDFATNKRIGKKPLNE